jgi:hypothetical protein
MVRLYEYWVFLQVLLACQRRYGDPLDGGFTQLAVSTDRGTKRLDLPSGTTVTFPGPVHVAFEPQIDTAGRGWMNLELVAHPDQERYQGLITPDVVVFRPDPVPWVTVIDAKYVGRGWVERSAWDMHSKYSRIRSAGTPVVRHVMVAHPHDDLEALWAGYGYVTMRPGRTSPLPLPAPPDAPPGR